MKQPHGWLVLDKPRGLGSTQAVAAVKRLARASKMAVVSGASTAEVTDALAGVGLTDFFPLVIAAVKHASFGRKQQEQVQRFADQLRVVSRSSAGCIGLFVSEAALDEGLLERRAVLAGDSGRRLPVAVRDRQRGYLGDGRGRSVSS